MPLLKSICRVVIEATEFHLCFQSLESKWQFFLSLNQDILGRKQDTIPGKEFQKTRKREGAQKGRGCALSLTVAATCKVGEP